MILSLYIGGIDFVIDQNCIFPCYIVLLIRCEGQVILKVDL